MLNISYDYQEQVGVISDRRLNISEEPRVPFFFFFKSSFGFHWTTA